MYCAVFSGGAAKIAHHIGAAIVRMSKVHYEAYNETPNGYAPIPYKMVGGTSSGGLMAACLSGGKFSNAYDMQALILSMSEAPFKKPFLWYLKLLKSNKHGFFDFAKLEELIESFLSDNYTQIPFYVGVWDIVTKRFIPMHFIPGSIDYAVMRKAVLASASVPIMFPPIDIGGHCLVDGGVTDVTPIAAMIKHGATKIDVFLASPINETPEYKRPGSIIDVAKAVYSGITHEVFIGDLRECLNRNALLKAGIPKKATDIPIDIQVIQPETMPGDSWTFSRANLHSMYEQGVKAGSKAVSLEEALSA